MVAELSALAVVFVAFSAEVLHVGRSRRVAKLAFGPRAKPSPWAHGAPLLRVAALGAMTWGMATLISVPPKVHGAKRLSDEQMRHLLLVLDVSPSMRLEDAGPTGNQGRLDRVADLMESFFKRVNTQQFWISVVAVYNGAKPVVVETTDMEVVRNILNDLPMHYAFEVGETRLFDGLEEAARAAKPWRPRSASLLLLSDGDTVPSTGMPTMPASVSHVLVVGVGDPHTGSFIEGHHSRQDVSTLRQISVRLGGIYHNGNEKQIPTDTLKEITQTAQPGRFERLTRREYALITTAAGATVLAFLPVLLHWAGTQWRPGVPRVRSAEVSPAGGTGVSPVLTSTGKMPVPHSRAMSGSVRRASTTFNPKLPEEGQ